jgi:hypothetical protein
VQLTRWLFALALVSTACGKSGDDDTRNDGCPENSTGRLQLDEDAPSDDPCRTRSGARLCGGDCPSLSAEECPGLGCVPVVDRVSGSHTGVGVCLADLPVLRTCWFCRERDGTTCVHLEGQGPVCVAEDVCVALHKLGAGMGCRYTDYSPYDGRPLAIATCADCPPNPTGGLEPHSCGPGCGGCGSDRTYDNCYGRSADFGFGICINAGSPCSVNEPRDEFCKFCATWLPVSEGDDLALDYGTCVTHEVHCDILEASGRISCNRAVANQ